MPDELETILRLVAEGRLTPEEAAPIIDALSRVEGLDEPTGRLQRHAGRIDRHMARASRRMDRALANARATVDQINERYGGSGGHRLRIRVTEHGRQVVNLQIPIGFVDAALGFVPGLAGDQADRIRDAVRSGAVGPILDVEDPDGSGVLISVE
jgi:hypothetical protein